MRIYGYCRISTRKQSLQRQERNIKEVYPDAVIVTDVCTGTRTDRPGWQRLLRQVRPGDKIVFDEVSRMSRNAQEGHETYKALYNAGIELVFLKEPYISTETYKKPMALPMTGTKADLIIDGVNRYLLALAEEQIRLAFDQAQAEVDHLRQRTREGIEAARLQGKQIGQPGGVKLITKKSIAAKRIIRKHSKDFGGTLTDVEVIALAGISRGTYYKYKRELRSL